MGSSGARRTSSSPAWALVASPLLSAAEAPRRDLQPILYCLFVCLQVPLEEGLNKTIQYFSRELEHQANNQYIPKPKAARMKKGRPRHN